MKMEVMNATKEEWNWEKQVRGNPSVKPSTNAPKTVSNQLVLLVLSLIEYSWEQKSQKQHYQEQSRCAWKESNNNTPLLWFAMPSFVQRYFQLPLKKSPKPIAESPIEKNKKKWSRRSRDPPIQTKPNQTKSNQTNPNQSKPNQTKPNQIKPNQTKSNQLTQ